MVYQDKTLTCVDCGNSFVFSADDQRYHAEKGYTHEPKRCPSCRQARRAERGGYSGGDSGFGRSAAREMYPAVCAQCGKNTEVPFRPRDNRPVYCNDCYRQERSRGLGNLFGRRY